MTFRALESIIIARQEITAEVQFNFFALLVLALFMDNLDELIIGKFYVRFDIRDWWYEQVSYHLSSAVNMAKFIRNGENHESTVKVFQEKQ